MNIGNMAKGMNDVERFELTGYVDTKNSGDYVRYTDYAEVRRLYQAEISDLQQQLAASKAEYSEAAQLCGKLADRADKAEQQLAAAREALALFVEFDDAGEPPGDICFEKARATLQRDRQP